MYVRVCEKKGPASAASASAFRISGCDAGIPVDLPASSGLPQRLYDKFHLKGQESV